MPAITKVAPLPEAVKHLEQLSSEILKESPCLRLTRRSFRGLDGGTTTVLTRQRRPLGHLEWSIIDHLSY